MLWDVCLGPDLQNFVDLSEDYLKFIIGSTYNSELQHAKLFPGNISSYFMNGVASVYSVYQVTDDDQLSHTYTAV